jgi:hypothetical protein
MEQAGEVTDQTRDAKTQGEIESQRRIARYDNENTEERRDFLRAEVAKMKAELETLLQYLKGAELYPDQWSAQQVTNFLGQCGVVQQVVGASNWDIAMRLGPDVRNRL